MIILNPFLLELSALFGRELVSFALLLPREPPAFDDNPEATRSCAGVDIGTSDHFHLQHTQDRRATAILAPIEAGDLAHFDVAVLVRPIFQDGIQTPNSSQRNIGHLTFACSIKSRTPTCAFCSGKRACLRRLCIAGPTVTHLDFAGDTPAATVQKWKRDRLVHPLLSRSSAVYRKIISSPPKDR